MSSKISIEEPAADEGKGVKLGVNFTITRPLVFQIVNGVLLLTHTIAQLFIWFESDWATDVIETYRNLLVGVALLFASNTAFFPERLRPTLYIVAIYIWLQNIDNASGGICRADKYINQKPSGQQTTNDYNTLRAGLVISLLASYPLFIINVLAPLNLGEAFASVPGRVSSSLSSLAVVPILRAMLFVAAACAFVISQFITWGIKLGCRAAPSKSLIYETNFLFIAFFLVMILIVPRAKHLVDFTLFYTLSHGLTVFAPIFDDIKSANQSNYPGVWRAQISIAFIGFLAVLAGVLLHTVMMYKPAALSERFTLQAIKARVFHRIFVALVLLVPLGLVGCILVWVKSPSSGPATFDTRSANWTVSMLGIVVPIFGLVSWVLQLPGVILSAVIMTWPLYTTEIGVLAAGTSTGVLRCGHIVVLCVATAVTLAYYSENVLLPRQADEYLKDENRSLTMLYAMLNFVSFLLYNQPNNNWWIVGVAATLLFFGASSRFPTLNRLVFLIYVSLLTAPVFVERIGWVAFVIVGWFAVWTIASGSEPDDLFLAPFYETDDENGTVQPLMDEEPAPKPTDEPSGGAAKYEEVSGTL